MEFIGNDIHKTNKNVLNEVYFGETDDIKELIQIIHDFRAPYMGKRNFSYVFPGSNTHPKLLELSEKLEEMFGFGAVDLNIINAPYMNAMTHPVCYNYGCEDPAKHIHSNAKGFYFDKELKYVTQISYTSNVFLNDMFTDREILAVLLHEIGHSFVLVQKQMVPLVESRRQMSIIQTIIAAILSMMLLQFGTATVLLKSLVTNNNTYKLFKATIQKHIKKTQIGKFKDVVDQSFDIFKMMYKKGFSVLSNIFGINNINKALTILMSGWIGTDAYKNKIAKNNHEINALDRSMEYFSDNFPASYGLGMDLTSALRKMEFSDTSDFNKTVDKIASLNPINMLLGEMVKVPYYELLNNLDVHPKYANRVSKIEQDLKKELAKGNMNPKLKKELQDTLKEIKNLKQEFKKTAKLKDSDPNAYKKIWMAAFMDEEDFLNKSEDKMTSMKDRDKFYEKMYTEHAEFFEIPECGYDPYEFM